MFDPKKFLKQANLKKHLGKVSRIIDDTKEIATSKIFDRDIDKNLNARSIRQLRLELLDRVEGIRSKNQWDAITMQRIEDIDSVIRKSLLKPKLAIVGMSDVGKSHLTNALLGTSKIPSDWSPMTSINIYIKHIEDRPDFLTEEVIIFSGDNNGFDINRVDEQGYAENHLLMTGNEELLVTYATRMSDEKTEGHEAKAAVVYLDSPILKRCDIIDVPGFGTGDRVSDDLYAQESRQIADIILYMSVSNAFMRGTDISFLKSTIDTLPFIKGLDKPLANLFVLASQSHIIGDEIKVNHILDAGMKRFYRSIPEEEWASYSKMRNLKYSEESVRERCYSYTTNDYKIREYFEMELIKTLDMLPILIESHARLTLKEMIEEQRTLIEAEVRIHETVITDRKNYSDQLRELENEEPKRQQAEKKERKEVQQLIEELKEADILRFTQEYAEIMDPQKIVSRIEKAELNKNEDGQNELVNLLSNDLKFRLNQTLETSTEKFIKRVDRYVGTFENSITISSLGSTGLGNSFNVKSAFLSGAVSAAAFGGMAAYAATLGNLGGYILVAKGAGILSALGVNVGIFGGMPGIMGGVAAIGGPITLGIALTAVIGFSVYKLLSSDWRSSMAKEICKEFEKQKVEEQFIESIMTYWNDTQTGFDTGVKELEKDWEIHLKNMRVEVESTDTSETERKIEMLSSYKRSLLSVIKVID